MWLQHPAWPCSPGVQGGDVWGTLCLPQTPRVPVPGQLPSTPSRPDPECPLAQAAAHPHPMFPLVPKGPLPGHTALPCLQGSPSPVTQFPHLSQPPRSPILGYPDIHLPQILRAPKLYTEGLPSCAPKHSPPLAPEALAAQSLRKLHHLFIT